MDRGRAGRTLARRGDGASRLTDAPKSGPSRRPHPGTAQRRPSAPGRIAILLPPRERFSPQEAGAVASIVHLLSTPADLVLGTAPDFPPFRDRGAFEPVRPAGLAFSSHARYAAGAARIIARTAPPIGLIEVHNRPAIAAHLARRLPDRRIALLLHNDPRGMRGTETPAARRRLTRSGRVHVAAVSRHLAALWAEGGIPAPAIVPNALDLAALPEPHPPASRDPVILFVGRTVHDKGCDLFVEACAAALPTLPGWRAEILGADRFGTASPETPFLAALRPRAREAGVAMPGAVLRDAVLEAMARAAIVVVPSRWAEPFGLVAIEAMACGAALVATGAGALEEITGAACLRVEPDPRSIAAALRTLATDPDLRARLGERGRARARAFDRPAALRALDRFRASCSA